MQFNVTYNTSINIGYADLINVINHNPDTGIYDKNDGVALCNLKYFFSKHLRNHNGCGSAIVDFRSFSKFEVSNVSVNHDTLAEISEFVLYDLYTDFKEGNIDFKQRIDSNEVYYH